MLKKALAVLFIIVAMGLVHLYIYTKIAVTGYKIGTRDRQLSNLRSSNRELAAVAAQRESLSRIEPLAKGGLKMVTPQRINYIIASEEGR